MTHCPQVRSRPSGPVPLSSDRLLELAPQLRRFDMCGVFPITCPQCHEAGSVRVKMLDWVLVADVRCQSCGHEARYVTREELLQGQPTDWVELPPQLDCHRARDGFGKRRQ